MPFEYTPNNHPETREKGEGLEREKLMSAIRARFKKAFKAAALVAGIAAMGAGGFYGTSEIDQLYGGQTISEPAEKSPAENAKHATQERLIRESQELERNLKEFTPHVHIERKTNDVELEPHYEHLENLESMHISLDTIKQTIQELPPQMVGNIGTIEFSNTLEPMGYNEKGYAAARIGRDPKTGRLHITFFRYGKEAWDSKTMGHVLRHELVHKNDWTTAPWMTPEEQIDCAYAVMERVKSGDRFKNDEVENIKAKTFQKALFRQMREYYAVMITQYLENPEKLLQKDRALAKHILSWGDTKQHEQ